MRFKTTPSNSGTNLQHCSKFHCVVMKTIPNIFQSSIGYTNNLPLSGNHQL